MILVPFFICLALCSLALSRSSASTACSEECGDYHRVCPGIKDPNFYNDYVKKYNASELGDFSDAPLPPPPSCGDPFYQIGCPHSCSLCTPCTVGSAEVQQVVNAKNAELQKRVGAEIQKIVDRAVDSNEVQQVVNAKTLELEERIRAEIQKSVDDKLQSITCNPCTQILGSDSTGKPTCQRKYDVVYEGECSCSCGQGTKTFQKKCKSYTQEGTGYCTQMYTDLSNCNDQGPASTTENCNNGFCSVSEVFEKTLDIRYAQTSNQLSYKAFTRNGQSCNLGVVKKSNDRRRNGADTYTGSQIQYRKCKDICLKEGESFDYIQITTSGSDGWDSDYVTVTVNGNKGTYSTTKTVDDRETVRFDKE